MNALTVAHRSNGKNPIRPFGKVISLKNSRTHKLKAIICSHTGKLVYMVGVQ